MNARQSLHVGGVELGGSNTVCAVASAPDDVRADTRFLTTTPTETLGRAIQFFRAQAREVPLRAIGLAAFGPLDLDTTSPSYGWITTTPKPTWAQTDVVGPLARPLGVPIVLDTDVNAAALAEHRWGAGRGVDPLVYVTVGTGIGGGAIVNGQVLHGLVHPEMGHMRVPHDSRRDPFTGACRYHGDCLEGLASGPAISTRWGRAAEALPSEHPAWELEAWYLALALIGIISTLSPRRIVLGGGVMRRAALFPMVRAGVLDLLGGYAPATAIAKEIDRYIVPAALGDRAGVLGAIALAHDRLVGDPARC
jgi:fructokinase